MEVLKLIAERLSQYHLLTNILPGTVLCIILQYIVGYNIILENYYQCAIVFYFVGLVNGRIGSLIVEPVLRKCHWLTFAPYKQYVRAEKLDNKLQTLNQDNNTYRSYVSVMFVSVMAYAYKHFLSIYSFIQNHEQIFLIVLLFVIFALAYRKQTGYIHKRVVYQNQEQQDNTNTLQ